MNVCGLKSKLQYPEFVELVNKYDIVCFQESKTDDYDEINLSGYIFEMKNRFAFSNRRSGGLVLGYKEKLQNYIECISTESKFVQWFKLSADYSKLEEDIIFGSVYIPPESTKYSSPESFREIENELLDFVINHNLICLLGDFNSRTSTDLDYIVIDDKDILIDSYDIVGNDIHRILNDKISLLRNNSDKNKNNYGNLLLELCKLNNLFIVNGRIGDNITGKLTSKNAAVVDYFIGTAEFLNIITDSNVLEFCSLFSDIHSPLEICIQLHDVKKDSVVEVDNSNEEKIRPWDNSKLEEFRSKLSTNLENLENVFEVDENQDLCQRTIDNITYHISDVFIQAAKDTFGNFRNLNVNSMKKPKNEKPWFNFECKNARKKFRKNKRLFKMNKTDENFQNKKKSEMAGTKI